MVLREENKKLKQKIEILETKIKHLTNDYDLTKEESEESIHKYLELLSEQKQTMESLTESEEKYSTLIEQLKDGVLIVQDGVLQFANRAFEKITGYTVKEKLGQPIWDLNVLFWQGN